MSRPGRLRRLGALLILLGILVGLPLLLDTVLERPTVEGLPGLVWLQEGVRYRYFEPEPILRLITLAAWVLWAYATLVTILRALADLALRLRLAAAGSLFSISTLLTFPPVRWAVDTAIGVTLLATTTLTPPRTTPPAPPTPVVSTIQPAALGAVEINGGNQLQVHIAAAAPAQPAYGSVPPAPADPMAPVELTSTTDPATGTTVYLVRQGERSWHFTSLREYTVVPADSLWRIAEMELPNPYWWRTIWVLNEGRGMVDYAGNHKQFDKPQFIRPGWVLWLPDELTPGLPTPDSDPPPPPPSTVQPEQTPPSTNPPPVTPPADDASGAQDDDGALSPGTVIAGSTVIAVLAALEILRRRRRRHRLPQPPTLGIGHRHEDDSALRRRLYNLLERAPAEEPDEDLDQEPQPPGVIDGHAEPTGTSPGQPRGPREPTTPSVEDQMNQQLHDQPLVPQPVAAGEHDGREVTIDLDQLGLLALVGPGAPAAVRALAVNALAANPSVHAVELLAVGEILPAVDCPGLRQVADLDQALLELDVQTLRRGRLLGDTELTNIAELRDQQPWEPLPTVLLVAAADRTYAPRLHALANAGTRLGLAAVLLANDPAEAGTLPAWAHIDPDGTAQTVTGPNHQWLVGVRLHQLDIRDAEALLGPIAESRRPEQHPQPPPFGSPATPAPRSQPPAEPAIPPPVTVTLLGAIRIQVGGQEIRTGLRRDVKPLLCYLVLHPEGATLGTVAAELWPETTAQQERDRWWNAVKNLHREVRRLGDDDLVVIERAGDAYRLTPGVVDADVWRFQRQLAEAEQAPDDAARVEALTRATELYGGPLAPLEQGGWSWADPERLSLHDQAIGALQSLADLHETLGDIDAATAALGRAIELDPVAESCYVHLMKLHARQHRPDALDRAYLRLQVALDAIGAQPDPETLKTITRLRDLLSQMDRLRDTGPPDDDKYGENLRGGIDDDTHEP